MHIIGYHHGPGLPNSICVHQGVDDIFQTFKGNIDIKTQVIFTRKTYEQTKLMEAMMMNKAITIPVAHLTNDDVPETINGKPEDKVAVRGENKVDLFTL